MSHATTASSSDSSSPKSAAAATKAAIAIVTGGCTGAIESFITYPTEFVKTQLQLQTANNSHNAGSNPVTTKPHPVHSSAGTQPQILNAMRCHTTSTAAMEKPATGIVDCVVTTVRRHGGLGLYRGMSPILAGSIPKQASRWGTFEAATAQVRAFRGLPTSTGGAKGGGLSLPELSICGAVAGVTEAAFAVIPTETVKTKFIVDQNRETKRYEGHKGLFRGIASIVRQDGIQGLYCGAYSTVAKQGLNQSVRFPVQACLITSIASLPSVDLFGQHSNTKLTPEAIAKSRKSNPIWNGIAGFGAGVISVMITQPFDVVKTKMQRGKAEGIEYGSSTQCARTIFRNGGIKAFYAGQVPRMMRVGLNVGLTFTVFPALQQVVAKQF